MNKHGESLRKALMSADRSTLQVLEVQLYLYVNCAPGVGVGMSGQGDGCDGGVPSTPLLPPSPL